MVQKAERAEIIKDEPDLELMFKEYARTKDVELRNKLVTSYMYLAEIISKKFVNRGLEYDDIFQVACIALMKAVERFSMDKGVKFVSFATPTIIGEIKRYFRDKGALIRIPRRIYEVYQKVNEAKEHLSQKLERPPRIDEIASYLGIIEENVLEIIESWNAYNMQSFDQSVYEDDDIELHETIGDVDSSFEKIENKDFLISAMKRLNDIEKQFVHMRYFEDKTQKQIAEKLGVSQMYVSRLEHKVIDKFRRILDK